MRGQAFVTFPSVELAHRALVCILQNAIWWACVSAASQPLHIEYFVSAGPCYFLCAISYDVIVWALSRYKTYNAIPGW
jgi:hypothetical protein